MYTVHYDHEIQYREFFGTLLPIVNISFGLADRELFYPMLVDTGADRIALPAWSAEQLGIRLQDDCTRGTVRSLAGYSDIYYYQGHVTMQIPDLDEHFRASCQITFSIELDQRSYGLLGRDCTLHHLAFGFHESKGHHAFYMSLSPSLRIG